MFSRIWMAKDYDLLHDNALLLLQPFPSHTMQFLSLSVDQTRSGNRKVSTTASDVTCSCFKNVSNYKFLQGSMYLLNDSIWKVPVSMSFSVPMNSRYGSYIRICQSYHLLQSGWRNIIIGGTVAATLNTLPGVRLRVVIYTLSPFLKLIACFIFYLIQSKNFFSGGSYTTTDLLLSGVSIAASSHFLSYA